MSIRLYITRIAKSFTGWFAELTLEKVSFLICFTLGTVFLLMGVFGPWRYLVLMGICYISAFMVTEEREH